MKILWASPFSRTSAIGRVSADVTRAMIQAGYQVELVATESEPVAAADLHPTAGEVRHWGAVDLSAAAARCDLAIANIGDNYLFHAGAFAILEHAPSLGIFHDFYLYNLFSGWLAARSAGPEAHDAQVVAAYGEGARPVAEAARLGQLSITEIAEQIPMTEWVARRCVGAMAHAEFYAPRLEAACPGPVSTARLPVTGRGVSPPAHRTDGGVTLVTVGVMNPNKCVERVIAAIGASDRLRQAVRYQLVGPIAAAEAARLRDLAARMGYAGLEIFGAVDDDELVRRLGASDLIACLRHPILEGASGSAIEGMLAGRPVLVADAGFYGDLPGDVVAKVPPEVEPRAILSVLERLAYDEPARRAMGARARAWAEAHFTVDQYVRDLDALAAATTAAAPLVGMGRRLGRELSALGLPPDDPIVARISGVLAQFLPTEHPSGADLALSSQARRA